MNPHQAILDCWNAQKEFGRWKTHRKLTPDIKRAIDENMRDGWEVEDICGAIVNFAACVHSRDTRWTHDKWSLAQFLTRGKRDDDRRWVWFNDNNYREDDWLTPAAVQRRIKARRQQELGEDILNDSQPARVSYKNMLDKELREVYDKANVFERTIIKRVRPDVETIK